MFKGLLLVFVVLVVAFCDLLEVGFTSTSKAAAGLFNHVAKCVSGFFDFFVLLSIAFYCLLFPGSPGR